MASYIMTIFTEFSYFSDYIRRKFINIQDMVASNERVKEFIEEFETGSNCALSAGTLARVSLADTEVQLQENGFEHTWSIRLFKKDGIVESQAVSLLVHIHESLRDSLENNDRWTYRILSNEIDDEDRWYQNGIVFGFVNYNDAFRAKMFL